MRLGGLLTAEKLTALANVSDEASIAMRWLEMIVPDEDSGADADATSTLKVIEDTNDFVRSIKEPLNLMSVMGPARSGKSTLMNLLAGCKTSELFATSSGFETFTKGVYIPTRVLTLPAFSSLENEPVVEATQSNVKVSFIDTEGQGAVGTEYDMNLFSPALVASRVIIHNRPGGLLTEDILRDLGMMTQAALRLRSASSETSGADSQGTLFGHLFIVFNQFRLNGTPDELKKVLLNEEKGNMPVVKNRNNIRKLLTQNFESIQVFTLPDDLKPSHERKKILLLDDFGTKFWESFKLLRSSLSTALMSPRELVKGNPVTGGSMADFMPHFAEAINKAEPLNLPNIFEGARNSAINKALAIFEKSLSFEIETLQGDKPKPTTNLDKEFEQEVLLLLAALVTTLSYMPPDVVKKVQADARTKGDTMKTSLLDANLARLRIMLSTDLNVEVAAINNDIQLLLPADRLISRTELDAKCASLLTKRTAKFKTRVESFDFRAAPQNYETALSNALVTQKTLLVEQAARAWEGWLSSRSTAAIQKLAEALDTLVKNTDVGDDDIYISGETQLVTTATSELGKDIDTDYLWAEKDAAKAEFKKHVEETRLLYRGTWDRDEQKTKTSLGQLVERLQLQYDNQLANAITPQAEPEAYDTLTSPTAAEAKLDAFCRANRLSGSIKDEVLLKFDTYVSSAKKNFMPIYQKASVDYTKWLNDELGRQVPLLTQKFAEKADDIPLDISSPATNKTSVATSCEAEKKNVLAQLTVILTTLRARKDGLISKSIVETFTRQLTYNVDVETKNKLAKYDEVVSAWNQVLLASIVEPIITQALDNKYATVDALDADVNGDKGKKAYDLKARGDKSLAGDAETRWYQFKTKQYPVLVNNIKAFNGFVVNGLDSDKAGTQEVQRYVIKNIYRDCALLAESLNMAWMSSGCFDSDAIEALKEEADPDDASNKSMTFLMRNEMADPGDDNNFDWEKRYDMEFFGWTFELSEVVWGTPIVTELKPLKLDSSEFPISTTPTKVTVGTKSTETTSITNSASRTLGFKLGAEVSFGQKDIWSAKVSGEFNASWTSSKSDTVTKTYETSTVAELLLPPNRANIVNQIVFNQRTSLPYTAKIRFIPKLRFKGGFTKWGGGGQYSENPQTGALKPNFKNEGRNYEDFTFPRCDQIRDKARANADPWDWNTWKTRHSFATTLDPLADPKSYEIYVRGKWEGLTGKYAITTVTPKSTALNLMPL